MADEKSLDIIIGERIRRERKKLNLTQEQLAEKCSVAKNTISTWESAGLADITKIQLVENVLGCDLMKDSYDAEGQIGEVGKEIINLLVINKGYLEYTDMKSKLYGMKEDRISKEIIKLENIGLCVRDRFKDFVETPRDIIFITAKGLITCKNINTNPILYEKINSCLDDVKVYEYYMSGDIEKGIQDAQDFEHYIELHPIEKIVRRLDTLSDKTPYMINYIIWLIRRYEKKFEVVQVGGGYTFSLLPSHSLYVDTILKMTFGINRNTINNLLYRYDDIYSNMCWEESKYRQENFKELEEKFKSKRIRSYSTDSILPWLIEEREKFEKAFNTQHIKETIELQDIYDQERSLYLYCKKMYDEKRKQLNVESPFPETWYKAEEIKEYLQSEAEFEKGEVEREIDELLHNLYMLDPSAQDYFIIYEDYDKDGLGSFVRELFNLDNN